MLKCNGYRKAAVMALFTDVDDEPHLLLTKRTHTVATHKGQISFPGGGAEAHDNSLLDTALRETEEEIGLEPNQISVWGESDDFITITDYWVKPFVAEFKMPEKFIPQPEEIAEILMVPLHVFTQKKYFREKPMKYKGRLFPVYFYDWKGYEIWGATAFMINRIIDILLDVNFARHRDQMDLRIFVGNGDL